MLNNLGNSIDKILFQLKKAILRDCGDYQGVFLVVLLVEGSCFNSYFSENSYGRRADKNNIMFRYATRLQIVTG
jgi:hypothetical protein